MNDSTEKSFDFGGEVTKQLLTLAVGTIAFTVTFAKDFVSGVPGWAKFIVGCGWFAFLISIAGGVMTLMAMTDELRRPAKAEENAPADALDEQSQTTAQPDVKSLTIANAAQLQIISFVVGIGITVVFGVVALLCPSSSPASANTGTCTCCSQANAITSPTPTANPT